MTTKPFLQTSLVGSVPFHSGVWKSQKKLSASEESKLLKCREDCVAWQEKLGLDIICEAEISRDTPVKDWYYWRNSYVLYFLQFLNGITLRDINDDKSFPYNINDRIALSDPKFINEDYYQTRQFTDKPIKICLPGVVTAICRLIHQQYYPIQHIETLMHDYALALRQQIEALIDCGVEYIQIDDPTFSINPDHTFDPNHKYYGNPFLQFKDKSLQLATDVDKKNTKLILHLCQNNPFKTIENYAAQTIREHVYFLNQLDAINNLKNFDFIHIEKPNFINHFDKFFTEDIKQNIVFGLIDIGDAVIETIEDITKDIEILLKENINQKTDFIIAPDCGMKGLDFNIATQKITNMVQAVSAFK